MVRRRKKAAPEAVSKTRTIVVDPKKRALEEFVGKFLNKRRWLRFNNICFLKIRVVGAGNSDDFENTIVKILEVPEWLEHVGWGSFGKFAAEQYGANVVAITVSKEQAALGQERTEGFPVEDWKVNLVESEAPKTEDKSIFPV